MADVSSSLFLQALGWATLNSFWQFALLWCCFQLLKHYITLNSNTRYLLSVYSIFIGFAWFVFTFFYFFLNEKALDSTFSLLPFSGSANLLPVILTSASIAYLSLLLIPFYKVLRNWRFIRHIKSQGLEKAPYKYRLFVQKISAHLGIRKSVKVYLSRIVKSPVTIGFLKPVILIPVAALNNLNVQQVEAVLLHELSHIKRHDYLLNLLLTLVHVFLYFNPFVKLFIRKIELERENCCDEMVLQFEYDKLSYATALLELEKQSRIPQLAMAAANKNYLLNRIEKIVGIKKKKSFNKINFAGAFATLFLLFIINSMIITSKQKNISPINYFSEPYSFFSSDNDTN
ncbi:MAG TPA: M56 family metallopeptidase, partial [Chitinophagaceae bacterium]